MYMNMYIMKHHILNIVNNEKEQIDSCLGSPCPTKTGLNHQGMDFTNVSWFLAPKHQQHGMLYVGKLQGRARVMLWSFPEQFWKCGMEHYHYVHDGAMAWRGVLGLQQYLYNV